jgi:hypothetical protein
LTPDETGHWIERERVLSPFEPGGLYGDEFGAEVALDGDTILVGAPLTNLEEPLSGYAYAYSRDGNGQWTLSHGFPPPSTRFGQSIALAGDRAVIASESEAIVVARDGSGEWSQEAALSADTVGTTVAFDGTTIVVAGRFSNLEIGAVLFVRQGGVWSPSAAISMPTEPFPGNPYMLVRDVSIEGDRLALGITNALGPDHVLVYERDAPSGEWIEKAALDPDGGDEGDGFGAQVGLRNGLLLVGATSVGRVYVYRRSGSGEWTEIRQLVASDPFFGQAFARAVHFGDGDPVVGAGDHENGLHAGAAYVFDLAPRLAVTGSCPGQMSFAVTGATPGGRVAFLRASGQGEFVVPAGQPCAGTELGLDGSARVARVVAADADGAVNVQVNVPAGACGFLQVVDGETCLASGVEGF